MGSGQQGLNLSSSADEQKPHCCPTEEETLTDVTAQDYLLSPEAFLQVHVSILV